MEDAIKAESSSSSSDSSSSNSDSSEDEKEEPKKEATKSESSSSSGDSSSDSSDDEPMEDAKKVESASSSSDSSSSNSDSSEDEKEEPKKEAVKTKSSSSSSDSSSSDSSDDEPTEDAKKAESSSSSSDSSSSDSASSKEEFKPSSSGKDKDTLKRKIGTPESSPKSVKVKLTAPKFPQPKSNDPPTRFCRIKDDDVVFADPRLQDNTFTSKGGAEGSYGEKAHRDLIVTRGKGFTKEKNKKKRGSYRGGQIDFASHSIKFDD
ncbi:jun-like transcription factor [Entomophthora muscae]|uniref:Jun-like transcription factor n=1 Tax=Entomophthora muscae TaxID=34485 RepID=A0ACC2RDP4_9FUNG|nr:jun-like transcription factor [Entomophthora muscae]